MANIGNILDFQEKVSVISGSVGSAGVRARWRPNLCPGPLL